MKELAAEAATVEEKTAYSLDDVRLLAEAAADLDRRIAKGEELLSKLKAERNEILSRKLVDVMDGARVPAITVDDREFSVGAFYHASVKDEDPTKDAAFDWLKEHEGGDLINHRVIVEIPRGHESMVKDIKDYITMRHQAAIVTHTMGVHWKRLTSWVKEFHERPETPDHPKPAFPKDLFNATVGRMVKIKRVRD